jgi:pimeloyl-ACP methyl ester carboxylesterase
MHSSSGAAARSGPVSGPGPATPAGTVPPVATHTPLLRQAEGRTVVTEDGVPIFYEVIGSRSPGAPVLVLANGLGGKLYAWEPLVERFARTHRIITWDYRGLFRSGAPPRTKQLAVVHHAQDALRILDQEGLARATFVGWSMGVQVSLEAALEVPGRVERLVLLNGSYGHIFETGLQPLLRLPFFHRLLHSTVEALVGAPRASAALGRALRSDLHIVPTGWLLARLWGNERLIDMYRQYLDDVFGESFENYLRLFQALDAHSVYHLLPEVTQPTLVISGLLDWLTPARMSFEIARRIPNAQHLHLPTGSHFAILERSREVVERIARFLEAT